MSKFQVIFLYPIMAIANRTQSVVTAPLVGSNSTSSHNFVLHKGHEAVTGGVFKNSTTNPPNSFGLLIFHGNPYKYFPCSPSASFARLLSSNESFVYFNDTRQLITAGAHHGTTQFMQPCPGCAITPQTKYTFQAKGTCSIFLTGNPPNRPKPEHQRFVRALKNCPCGYRQLVMASGAFEQCLTNRPCLEISTSRAGKTVWPSYSIKIVPTSVLRRKPALKFSQVSGVFFHTPTHYMWYEP